MGFIEPHHDNNDTNNEQNAKDTTTNNQAGEGTVLAKLLHNICKVYWPRDVEMLSCYILQEAKLL